jgi:hypothetical protein
MGCKAGFNVVKKRTFLPLPGIEAIISSRLSYGLATILSYPGMPHI